MSADKLRTSETATSAEGLYLHIPFCEQHCHYCAFPVAVRPRGEFAAYVRRLVEEVRLAELDSPVRTLYLGGGTPSLLEPTAIETIFQAVPRVLDEISLEANPGTLEAARLAAYRAVGVTRVSLGAQSFDPADLRRAGRLHSPEDVVRDFEMLRGAGFDNINLDLIAGLPSQDRAAWSGNLDWVRRLRPEHVSIYMLEIEDSTHWARRRPRLQDEEDYAWFYTTAAETLEALGYRHYEVSNWAAPGRECLHNLGYWDGRPYRGCGLGAHSFSGGRRFWNTRSMSGYAARLDAGVLPIEAVEERTFEIRLEEAFLLGLRRIEGFDVRRVALELGFEYPQAWFDRVAALEQVGLVEFDGWILRVARAGRLLTTSITDELLCPELLSISAATP